MSKKRKDAVMDPDGLFFVSISIIASGVELFPGGFSLCFVGVRGGRGLTGFFWRRVLGGIRLRVVAASCSVQFRVTSLGVVRDSGYPGG